MDFEVLDEFPALPSLDHFQLFLGNNRRIVGKVVGPYVFQVRGQRILDILLYFGYGLALRQYARNLFQLANELGFTLAND